MRVVMSAVRELAYLLLVLLTSVSGCARVLLLLPYEAALTMEFASLLSAAVERALGVLPQEVSTGPMLA